MTTSYYWVYETAVTEISLQLISLRTVRDSFNPNHDSQQITWYNLMIRQGERAIAALEHAYPVRNEPCTYCGTLTPRGFGNRHVTEIICHECYETRAWVKYH
jgi:hypothetical protein